MSGRIVQGWHSDPFGIHEARYFSADGQPTKLVRDRGAESYDEPPSGADEVAAAMARISAVPEPPSAYGPRDAYPYGPASERGPRRRASGIIGFAASAIILAAVAVGAVLVALTIMHPSKSEGTPGATGDAAFVTQAATRTLQQRTADVVLSARTSGGTDIGTHGTGAFSLDGKAGTLNLTVGPQAGVMAFQELWLDGHVYVAMSVGGRSLLPKGKAWVVEPISGQQSGTTDHLTGGNVTAALVSLENQGISVRALGTKVIDGVSCTGYTVTPPDAQETITVWINSQHLVREISANTTVDILFDRAPASAATTGTPNAATVDLTMDFSYSAAPVHVTAPPAASTESYDAFLQQLGRPAPK